jgi:hypothetical protein
MSIKDVIKKATNTPLRANQRSITVKVPVALDALRSELDVTMQALVGAMIADGMLAAKRQLANELDAVWVLDDGRSVLAAWKHRPTADDLRKWVSSASEADFAALIGYRYYEINDVEYSITEVVLSA